MKACCFFFVIFLLWILTYIGGLFMIINSEDCYWYGNEYDCDSDYSSVVSGICLMLVGVFAMIFLSVLLVKKYNKRVKTLRDKIDNFIQQENHQFEKLGLRFRISPLSVKWVELWLDFKYLESNDQARNVP